MTGIVTRTLLLALALSGAGCSLALVRGPDRSAPRSEPLRCTTSEGIPKLDFAAGVILIGASLKLFGVPTHASEGMPKNYGLVSLPIGAVLLAASRWGAGRVEECRYVEEFRRRCDAGVGGGCPAPTAGR